MSNRTPPRVPTLAERLELGEERYRQYEGGVDASYLTRHSMLMQLLRYAFVAVVASVVETVETYSLSNRRHHEAAMVVVVATCVSVALKERPWSAIASASRRHHEAVMRCWWRPCVRMRRDFWECQVRTA